MNLNLILLGVLALLGHGVLAQRGAYLGDDMFLYKLQVSQDVLLESGSTNYNSLEYLLIALHPSFPLKRSLVQFESLPSDSGCDQILGARMLLYFSYAHKASFYSEDECPYVEHEAEVYMVASSWDETSATSTLRRTGQAWNTQYLALDGTDAYSDVIDRVTMFPGTPSGRWVEFEVTEAVEKWVSEGYDNNGLLVKVEDEDIKGRDLRFYSSAYSDSAYHPYIHVLCREGTSTSIDTTFGPIPIDPIDGSTIQPLDDVDDCYYGSHPC